LVDKFNFTLVKLIIFFAIVEIPSLTKKPVPQTQPIPEYVKIMVKNNAGGYGFKTSDKELLERILILGTASNTYYSTAQKLTEDAIKSIESMLQNENGDMVVDTALNIYNNNRAPKLDPTLMVLAKLSCSTIALPIRRRVFSEFLEKNTYIFTIIYICWFKKITK